MKPQTSIKLAVIAVIAVLFSAVILRAALRLAATAMHSMLGLLVIVLLIALLVAPNLKRSR